MRYFVTVAILLFSAAAQAESSGLSIFVGNITSVKLTLNENALEKDGVALVSTGCGTYFAEYSIHQVLKGDFSDTVIAEGSMGEECHNPFDYRHSDQLVFLESLKGRLRVAAYYLIQKSDDGASYILPRSLIEVNSSEIAPFIDSFDEPVEFLREDDIDERYAYWISEMLSAGMMSINDGTIYITKAAFLDSVIEFYSEESKGDIFSPE